MNIYIGWLVGIIIFGLFLAWGISLSKKKYSTIYYCDYSQFIDLAVIFLPISGLVLAYPFCFRDEEGRRVVEWSWIYQDFLKACVAEVILLFCIFVPVFYKKVRLEKSSAALREAFINGALKYGVTNGHFEPHHKYTVKVNELNLEAPAFYMYFWSRRISLDEVTLTDIDTGEKRIMSSYSLWARLEPIGKPGYIVFPWEVRWEKGTFPQKEFKKWCKVRGITRVSISA